MKVKARSRAKQCGYSHPGTPAIREAYVRLYEVTGERVFLDAARAVADVLYRGQFRSGGWSDRIDLEPAARARAPYRIDPPGKKQKGFSSLDDDNKRSQAASPAGSYWPTLRTASCSSEVGAGG